MRAKNDKNTLLSCSGHVSGFFKSITEKILKIAILAKFDGSTGRFKNCPIDFKFFWSDIGARHHQKNPLEQGFSKLLEF